MFPPLFFQCKCLKQHLNNCQTSLIKRNFTLNIREKIMINVKLIFFFFFSSIERKNVVWMRMKQTHVVQFFNFKNAMNDKEIEKTKKNKVCVFLILVFSRKTNSLHYSTFSRYIAFFIILLILKRNFLLV